MMNVMKYKYSKRQTHIVWKRSVAFGAHRTPQGLCGLLQNLIVLFGQQCKEADKRSREKGQA